MLECCILFAHHRDDAVTRQHLSLLRERNPYPVIAVCHRPDSAVEEAIDLAALVPKLDDVEVVKWSGSDQLIYHWFLHRGFDAKRYVYLEWDSYVTMPIRDWYGPVWNADAACSRIERIEKDPAWNWFSQLGVLPTELRRHAAGICPLNGVLLSHRVLREITARDIPSNVFCELRLGTLVRSAGFEITQFPTMQASTNEWSADLIRVLPEPGLYHPVKNAVAASGDLIND